MPRNPDSPVQGTNADPEFRRRRAQRARAAQTSVDHYISKLADAAPELTAEQRERLVREVVDAMPPFTPEQRARLRPILAGTLPARTAGDARASA